MENLDRGVVAVRKSSNEIFISWRLLGTEPEDTAFDVYRNSTKINKSPLIKTTFFIDETSENGKYSVKPTNKKDASTSSYATVWENPYHEISLQQPLGGTTPDGREYSYTPNDCSVGDLDGDGQYEIILKWDPTNAKDNSHNGYTGNVYIDAYELNGTQLWRIDLGKNIRAGAHYTQFMVYDLDSDGKAEVAIKTADGTIDGKGKVIGDPRADYRNGVGRILSGPEFLTVFNGETGAAMATTKYLPSRHPDTENPSEEKIKQIWGDAYGNRMDRFLAGVGYFNGKSPSLVMSRGYYSRTVLVAWDWKDNKLDRRWIFDTNNKPYEAYASQGNHQLSIADVDQDGRDEVVFGSMTVDDNGKGLYNSGLGHGDAMHVSDLLPNRPGLEIWTAQEDPDKYRGKGLWLREAKTGDTIWGVPARGDIGRGLTANIDPRYSGNEMWGAIGGLYSSNGEKISDKRLPMNFAIWWDGDLQRELLDKNVIYKWNYNSDTIEKLLVAEGTKSNNGTKATPALSADILGDWREEVILRAEDNKSLRIYTTTIPTDYRFYTLMHDPQYRLSIAWQNVAYNQPPHTSFFIGEKMEAVDKPEIEVIPIKR
ncbi:rhamnogalacturonan lyase [Gramella sp. AN32]|nr:rhamnogalacturonan lyase [Gramella sp. AN32]